MRYMCIAVGHWNAERLNRPHSKNEILYQYSQKKFFDYINSIGNDNVKKKQTEKNEANKNNGHQSYAYSNF